MPRGDDNSVRELDPVQMSSWMDKLWKNSLPEKQLSEQVNRMNYPTQTNGRIKSHWFYYNKGKVNADIVKWWKFKKVTILMNFRRENKLDFNIASLKDHRTTRDWLCQSCPWPCLLLPQSGQPWHCNPFGYVRCLSFSLLTFTSK